MAETDRSDINRLLKAFRHQEADRVPHLEFWITSKTVYEHVLGRPLDYEIVDAALGEQSIAPEDHIEFAQRLGMDAVICNFSWRPNNVFGEAEDGTSHYVDGSLKTWADLEQIQPPPLLDAQLRHLERYLCAADSTGVGVFANFTSFFDSTLLAVGVTESMYRFREDRPFLEKLMDTLLNHQEKVMRAVCGQFGRELGFVLVNDDIAYNSGLLIHPDLFLEIFPHRMRRLIAPAKEHGKLLAMHTDGRMKKILPLLDEIGFNIVHPMEPESNDIFELKKEWAGQLAMVGNIPTPLLAYGAKDEIQETVKEYCERLGPGGGWALGSSTSIMDGIPPENFVTMTEAVHKYGRYEDLRCGAKIR